jgi:hypothetical protein
MRATPLMRLHQAAMKSQGYESSPPACANCTHYQPPVQARPGEEFLVPKCGIGGFRVRSRAICDKWIGRSGEKLETV